MTDTVIDDPMLDDEWLAAPARRSRLRTGLVAALAAAVCFYGGTLVHKHLGTDEAAPTAGGPAGLGGQLPDGLPEGLGQGGLPGGGTAPGTTGDGAAGGDGGSVIGTVVKVRGQVWTVEDLGGTRHTVQVGEDTDVVRETHVATAEVEVGDPVDITGTASDGRLQADEVALR
jgi:hypothetical protein